jgi:integrase
MVTASSFSSTSGEQTHSACLWCDRSAVQAAAAASSRSSAPTRGGRFARCFSICASGWIFPNTIGGALDLDNLADRIIKPVLKANGPQWKGWQAYRRGLATNLKRLGIPDTVIQAILRHTDVGTKQRFYIKTVREDVKDAMKQLEWKIQRAAVVQQPEPTGLVN